MKKILFVLSIIIMLSMQANAAGPVSFGLQATGANINVPDPLKQIYGFGFGGGAHLDINLPVIFAIRLQGDYITFSPDEGKYRALVAGLLPVANPTDITIEGGRINIFSANANTKLSPLPLPILSPYLTAGAGIASLSANDVTVKYQGNTLQVPGAKAETNFSANLGAGVDLDLIAVKLYLEARYTWIFTSGSTSTYVPVSIGVTF